jgi:hypothetical protein
MAREGRELELIVSRIEAALVPSGAIIKSPDRIKDKVTGVDREVDVSIRYQIGSVPILITVECRDRNDPQDDTWLEQLATKRWKVGAAKTIAVSSSGFTAPAITHARLQGIEVRRLEEITDEEVRRWFQVHNIQNIVFRSELVGVMMHMYGDTPGELEFDPEWRARVKQDSLHTPAFEGIADGRRFCVEDLIRKGRLDKPEFFLDIPREGTRVRKELNFDFPTGMLRCLALRGHDVKRVTITLDLLVETVSVPLEKIVMYADESNPLAYAAESEVLILGEKLIITVVRRSESREIAIRVAPAEEGKKMIILGKPGPA